MDKDKYFMEIAFNVSKASKCKRAQYGSVIISKDERIISTGYNGKPRNSINDSVCYREGLPDNSRGIVKIDNSPIEYSLVKLSKDTCCFIDKEDEDWVNQWKWYLNSSGYAVRNLTAEERVTLKRTSVRLHRELAIKHGILQDDTLEVDHISGNPLDNRSINLRSCSHAENLSNGKNRINNTSGFKGVGKCKDGLWRAYIKKDGKFIHLGKFADIEEARNSYLYAAQELFGEFVRTSDVIYRSAPNCCIHSEVNALLFSDPIARLGGTIYVSGIPCTDCTLLIAQSGLSRCVYYKNKNGHKGNLDQEFINKYGIKVKFDVIEA